jgi:tRNA nucleotidyltransferase/poly(A) polymerase
MTPKDVDFVVVGSTPEEMLARGFKQVGADFPVFLNEDGQEFALARTERKTGRGYKGFSADANPDVTLEQDLERRDLTINAMAQRYENGQSELVDPFNGQEDLKNKVLRHVSPAFAEDPLRVLRLARFHARFGEGWTVAPETLAFCRELVESGEVAELTRERVLAEYQKAMSEQAPHLFFSTLRDCGALQVVFPELAELNSELLHWTLANFSSRKFRFNHAKVTAIMPFPEFFEQRLNVGNSERAYSTMFRKATMIQPKLHPVNRLYKMDAYRNTSLFGLLLLDATEAGMSMGELDEAFEATKHVNFATLSEEARKTLKGPAVAEAIATQRMFAYANSARK